MYGDLLSIVSMVEQKENKAKNIVALNSPGGSGQNLGGVDASKHDFSGMGNLKLNDLDVIPTTQNLISQANAQEEVEIQKEEVRLEDFSTGIERNEGRIGAISLGKSGLMSGRSRYHNQYWKIFLISAFIILVTGISSIILRLYSRYIYFASQAVPDTTYQTYINIYKQGQIYFDQTLNLSNYQKYTSLSLMGSGEQANIDTVVNEKTLGYIQKKDILQKALNSFSPVFINNNKKLTVLKEDISKYGFFSQELYDMLENQDYATSIKKYLLSLEIIKFSSAIKVFSYLDTFVSSLANALGIPSTQVESTMKTLVDRGEKDILVYLNTCYLNPYEIDYECKLVGDFDRYYTIIDKEKTPPDTNFFKKMMYYVDTKLEQTDLPSFSITFKKYDPTQKQISFTVDVNTFKQDEVALIKKGIISPHIFIVSNLLNLIKQSIFVVSENIDAKSIKISPKIIKIGSSVFNVNNSTMNFVLPIQKGSEREISDYIDPIFTSSQ